MELNGHTLKPGTPEHATTEHGTPGEQRNTPEHQRNTPQYQQNTNVTLANHPGTTEPYKTKKNGSDFKENLNLTLIHVILSTQGGNIFYY